MQTSSAIAVIGCGLAASTLLYELLHRSSRHARVLWIGRGLSPRAGSSVPVALLNPFPGVKIRHDLERAEAWKRARAFITRATDAHAHEAYLRRVVPKKHVARWEGLLELGRGDLNRRFGPTFSISRVERGVNADILEYGPVLAYEPRPMLEALRREMLASPRLEVIPHDATSIEPVSEGWCVSGPNFELTAKKVAVAAGVGSASLLARFEGESRLWANAGELVVGPGDARALERFSVHGGHLSSSDRRVAWGSSYEQFAPNDPRPPAIEQLEAIYQRLRAVNPEVDLPRPLPHLRWTGDRAVHHAGPNAKRTPWVERVERGLFAFTGFGSTGSLDAPAQAARMAIQLAR